MAIASQMRSYYIIIGMMGLSDLLFKIDFKILIYRYNTILYYIYYRRGPTRLSLSVAASNIREGGSRRDRRSRLEDAFTAVATQYYLNEY